MPGFATIAMNIALSLGFINQSTPPIADSQYGKLLYEVRSVNRARGMGGSPAYCARPNQDVILMVYTVRNDNDYAISAQAVPRLVMLDPSGLATSADRERTEALKGRLSPYLTIRGGRLEAGQTVVLADVFTTPRNATRDYAWNFRIAPLSTRPVLLPEPVQTPIAECV